MLTLFLTTEFYIMDKIQIMELLLKKENNYFKSKNKITTSSFTIN